jgi:hypothetical protein
VEQQHRIGELDTQVEMVQGASQVPEPALSLCENNTKERAGSTGVDGTVKEHFTKGLNVAPLISPSHESEEEIDSEDFQLFARNKRSLTKAREVMGSGKKKKSILK